jgi:hypothetical protein
LLKLIKNIIAMSLLLVFILAGEGITVLTHYCSGSKTTTRQIFPEFIHSNDACTGMSCNVSLKNSRHFSVTSIGKTPCCKENTVFFKVATVYNPSVKDFMRILPVIHLLVSLPFRLALFQSESIDLKQLQFRCSPPPLSGRLLVVFLRQLRLPASTFSS